jgi:hypothetical protein
VEVQREIRQSRKLDMLNLAASRLRLDCTENMQLMPEEIERILHLRQKYWKDVLTLRIHIFLVLYDLE